MLLCYRSVFNSVMYAGAMSMAAGEYVSVCSQADLEAADLAREQWEIEHNYEGELAELSLLYQGRGLGTLISCVSGFLT